MKGVVDLLHEIWVEADPAGKGQGTCLCLAGPDGEPSRRLLEPGARLVHTFLAGSHYEAATIYNRYFGYEPYVPDPEWEDEVRRPYPPELAEKQKAGSPST